MGCNPVRRIAGLAVWGCRVCITLIAVVVLTVVGSASEAVTVRVGLYENMPKVFTDKSGKAAGIFIDLLDEMAIKEEWKLVYVPCEWPECLRALEDGRIDLMPDVAYSQERDEKYDFHRIQVAESWSHVYSNSRVPIARMSDLNGRRVALLKESIQEKAMLLRALNGFGYNVTIVPAGSIEESFRLVSKGSADAVITNHLIGDLLYQKFGLAKTPIVYNVVSLYYATAQGRNSELLEAIDRHLGGWIKEPDSPYYKTLCRWVENPPEQVLPRYVFWIFGIIAGLLGGATGMIWLLRRRVAARTMHLARANEELHRHREHLEELVNERTRELLRTQEQLIQSQKMEAVGQLAGGIAHDFNNTLAVVLGTSELILGNLPLDDPNHTRLCRVIKAGKRAKDLTSRLLTFARKEKLEIGYTRIRDILLDIVDILLSSITKKIEIHTSFSEGDLVILGDANQLGQALLNICINACDAMKEGGKLRLDAAPVYLEDDFRDANGLKSGDYCLIQIGDEGRGIPADMLNRIFEPFFTTKEKGDGTGLGLSVTEGIVKMHNGLIEVESEMGKGTNVKVYLPTVRNPHDTGKAESDESPRRGNRETILIVDDETDFTDMMSDFLSGEGYNPVAANSGKEALDIFEKCRDDINLVLLDIMMPGMDGGEVFTALRRIRRDVRVVLCSGFSVEGKAREIMNEGACAFIQKPYDIQSLLKTISDVLRK